MSLEERFWAKVDKGDGTGCWLWTGARNDVGYGQIWVGDRIVYAHRAAYEMLVGPIPEGMQIDHLCRTPLCVRALDHLEPVTQRENILRGTGFSALNARKTHCPQGHPFSEENTYYTEHGSRRCRTCSREHKERERRAAGVPLGNKRKTHCRNGHPFDEVNTRTTPDGKRVCRTCHRENERERKKA